MSPAGSLSEALNNHTDAPPRPTRQDAAAPEPDLHLPTREQIKSGDTAILDAPVIVARKPKPTRPRASTRPPGPAHNPRPTATRQRPAPSASGSLRLKRTLIPIALTVGLVMLGPAAWGIAQLTGFEVPKHDDPKARQMAIAMVATLPVGLGLIAGAIYFWVQTSKQLRRQRGMPH